MLLFIFYVTAESVPENSKIIWDLKNRNKGV